MSYRGQSGAGSLPPAPWSEQGEAAYGGYDVNAQSQATGADNPENGYDKSGYQKVNNRYDVPKSDELNVEAAVSVADSNQNALTSQGSWSRSEDKDLNILAIATLVLGLLGMGVIPVITGHIALSQIKRRDEGGKPLAIAGIALGYLMLGLVTVLVILGVIGIIALIWKFSALFDAILEIFAFLKQLIPILNDWLDIKIPEIQNV